MEKSTVIVAISIRDDATDSHAHTWDGKRTGSGRIFGWAGCGTGEKVKKEQSKKQEVKLYGQRLAEIDFQEEV